jgi:hypothetical protein
MWFMMRALLAVFLFIASACGYYTQVSTVQRDASGGTLAVGSDRASRDEARRQMEEHCDGSYTIVDERRVVVGQESTTQEDGVTVVTKDIYEVHLSYECVAR